MNKLIARLNNIEWTKFDKYKTTAVGTVNGREIELKVSTTFNTCAHLETQSPMNVRVDILVDGQHAYAWDLTQTPEQREFATWFLTTDAAQFEKNFSLKSQARDEAETFFKSI